MFAIIDVETTGGSAKFERITEIAIVRHDGERVVDTFSTLLNPERSIPWNITRITGITNDMVANAPKFYEVAKRIVEITEGAIFVAHNVSFDYEFVRVEFERLGYVFSRKQLCTVRLSRKTFPGLKSYSLSNLKAHFGIRAERSHRAMDDTLATVELFERILAEQNGTGIKTFVNQGIREAKLPEALSLERLHEAPESCGVYYLYDENSKVVYVGKSLNIRKRLFEHFADPTPKGEKMRTGVVDFSYEITGSELVALLLESAEIKRLQPRINRAQRTVRYQGAIYTYTDPQGYRCLAIGGKKIPKDSQLELVAEYPKLDHAKKHLEALRRQYELCNRLCNLDHGEKACFYYTIRQCRGACVGQESVTEYNERADAAFAAIQKRLSGSFVVLEPGRSAGEQAAILVIDGQYRGYTYIDTEAGHYTVEDLLEMAAPPPKDPQAAQILHSYLSSELRQKAKLNRL